MYKTTDVAKAADTTADVITSPAPMVIKETAGTVGEAVDNTKKVSSRILRDNLEASGIAAPEYKNAAHHIVAGTASKASEARAILDHHGIGINDAINGAKCVTNDSDQSNKTPALPTPVSMRVRGILDEDLQIQGTEVSFSSQTNSQVDLTAGMFGLNHTFVDGVLDGIFNGELLGNFTDINGGTLKCALGYHKSSLSVIQNVILARNYEYQWIYTHHKVVYYSNFLLVDLFRNCINFLLEQSKSAENGNARSADGADEVIAKILSWKTMINHSDKGEQYEPYVIGGCKFFRPTDADILYLFKKCKLECIPDSSLGQQLKEYYTRKYKKSLWKSYAEFNIFFSGFTDAEKKELLKQFEQNSSYQLAKQYGYLSESWEKAFNSFGLKNVVWVNGDSKLKHLDPDKTYVRFKDISLTYRTVDSIDNVRLIEKLNLFYIYYDAIDESHAVNIAGLKEFLRSQIS